MTPSRAGDNALSDALAETVAAFVARNPASRAAHDRALAVLPGGNTRSVLHLDPFPLAMVRGEGCRLWDADGHEYIDFLGEFTAGIYGHSDPRIAAAITEAVAGGLNFGSQTLREAQLAELIQARFPSMELLRFTNSGTEANLMALALATAHTGRATVMVFEGGYHGGVLTFPPGGSPVNVPHPYVMARFNDLDGTRDQIRAHAADLAAVIVEPMMGGGGCIAGDPDFLRMLREETFASGALLIFDEVMTSRLSGGGMQGRLGFAPDLTTMGKYIGGGMSAGAFGGRGAIMARFDPRRADALPHAGTFNNNALSMAAGTVGLRDIFTPAAADALNARGDLLRDRLNATFRAAGVPVCVAGVGSLMNIHPVAALPSAPHDLAHADKRARDLIFFDLLEMGIYLARRGLMALSLPLGEAEADRLVAAVHDRLPRWKALLPA
jgi:glutamate-1-semialdehyde 2,1-aminomutase